MYGSIRYSDYIQVEQWRVSVDSLRIKYVYRTKMYDYERKTLRDTFADVYGRLYWAYADNPEPLWESQWQFRDTFKIGGYAALGTFTCGLDSSFSIMLGRYDFSSSKQVAAEAVLDINPNKIPPAAFQAVVRLLRVGSIAMEIQRYDLAFDIPLPRCDVRLVKNPRMGYKLFDEGGAVTEYQGQRGHDGALKVYDKTKEDGLEVDVTRVEITYDGQTVSHSSRFPRLHNAGSVQTGVALSDMPFAVQAVFLCPDLVDVLRRSVSANTFRKTMRQVEGLGDVTLRPDDWRKIDDFVERKKLEVRGF